MDNNIYERSGEMFIYVPTEGLEWHSILQRKVGKQVTSNSLYIQKCVQQKTNDLVFWLAQKHVVCLGPKTGGELWNITKCHWY